VDNINNKALDKERALDTSYDTNIYWIRAHISKQELTNRFIIGDKLIEDKKEHHTTEIAWLRYLAKRGLSRDQAQRYMRVARRFSSEQRQRIIDLHLPWKAVELLSRTGITDEHIEHFLSSITKTKPTIDQCMMLLHSVLYPSSDTSEPVTPAMPANKTTQVFLEYLKDTIEAMHRYLASEYAKETKKA
jgi:hypothetical protein